MNGQEILQAEGAQAICDLQIAGLSCSLFLPEGYAAGTDRYPVVYVNGEIPAAEIMAGLRKRGVPADFILLSVKPESWNDDFTPWSAPAFRRQEAPPQGRAEAYIRRLTEEIKPYMDANYRTKPDPEHTALLGYSLGGLTALYAMYLTDRFGWVGSLSGSLWYDGFCEFMERKKPLRLSANVYLSLGEKESRSRNPRMGRVAECTERARKILEEQLTGEVCLEWNEGGHFHDVAGRFVRAAAWLFGRYSRLSRL